MIGKTVGKYRILDRLGKGGMGTVYRAVDETLDREVAIKVLNAEPGENDVLKRFRAEAMTLARLSHPGIAVIYELYRQDDDLLMVMEYVRGETVHALSERLGPLAVPQAAHICMQVLDALAHAHRAGIVHRDLKPANLMVTESGAIKVMDFGIARMLGTEHFTQGGYMMGTPAYMAPEQVLGRDIDGRADLYAIGVLCYRLLAGELPFKADTSIGMVQKQISEAPTPIATFRPDLPPWCTVLIERSLAKEPDKRFQTAEEFRTAISAGVLPEALGELPTMATPSLPGLPIAATTSTLVREPTAPPPPPVPLRAPDPPTAPTTHGQTTVVLGRTHLATLGGVLLVLLAGIVVLAYLALRRDSNAGTPPGAAPETKVEAPAGVPTPPPAVPPPAPSAPAPAPTAAPSPGSPAKAAGSPDQKALSPDARGNVAAAGKTTPPAAGADKAAARGAARGDLPAPPGAGAEATARGPEPPAPAPPPRSAPTESSTPLIVGSVRFSQHDGRGAEAREREAGFRLGDGQMILFDRGNRTPLTTVHYTAMQSAFISRGPEPRWKAPDGTEVIGKVDPGRFRFLRDRDRDRNWLVVIPQGQQPIVIRLSDAQVRDVVTEFHNRSGLPVQRVGAPQ